MPHYGDDPVNVFSGSQQWFYLYIIYLFKSLLSYPIVLVLETETETFAQFFVTMA